MAAMKMMELQQFKNKQHLLLPNPAAFGSSYCGTVLYIFIPAGITKVRINMEKSTQDKSSTDTQKAHDQDPDRYNAGYGSFTEEDYDKKEGSTTTGSTDKANIETGLNEDKNTVSDTSAPSGTVADKETETNSNAS